MKIEWVIIIIWHRKYGNCSLSVEVYDFETDDIRKNKVKGLKKYVLTF